MRVALFAVVISLGGTLGFELGAHAEGGALVAVSNVTTLHTATTDRGNKVSWALTQDGTSVHFTDTTGVFKGQKDAYLKITPAGLVEPYAHESRWNVGPYVAIKRGSDGLYRGTTPVRIGTAAKR